MEMPNVRAASLKDDTRPAYTMNEAMVDEMITKLRADTTAPAASTSTGIEP